MFSNVKYNSNDTIYAPATPAQKSGLIVVRVSGAKVAEVIKSFQLSPLKPRCATLTKVYHPQTLQLIDNAIAIFYQAPNSFTGEDVLELHLHGSRAILKSALDGLSTIEGLRIAEPGEFSMRSFLNGKMDLTQVEGLADLIEAETEAQAAQALKQMSGSLKEVYDGWRQKLLKIISMVEAHIDFPDDDIPEDIMDGIKLDINNLAHNIKEHLEDGKRGEKLKSGLYITILGPTNAGKSSIMNRIVKRDVAITSQVEGTTRDVIEVNLDINGYPVTIADTAGIRETASSIENEGIKRSIARAESADLKIVVLDATKNFSDHSTDILSFIDDRAIVVLNKIDLINTDELPNNVTSSILVSTKENKGIDTLLKDITNFAKNFFAKLGDSPLITRERYRENLLKCSNALSAVDLNDDAVLAAEDLRSAANYLGRITGAIDVESILGEIFTSFCIGK